MEIIAQSFTYYIAARMSVGVGCPGVHRLPCSLYIEGPDAKGIAGGNNHIRRIADHTGRVIINDLPARQASTTLPGIGHEGLTIHIAEDIRVKKGVVEGSIEDLPLLKRASRNLDETQVGIPGGTSLLVDGIEIPAGVLGQDVGVGVCHADERDTYFDLYQRVLCCVEGHVVARMPPGTRANAWSHSWPVPGAERSKWVVKNSGKVNGVGVGSAAEVATAGRAYHAAAAYDLYTRAMIAVTRGAAAGIDEHSRRGRMRISKLSKAAAQGDG